jgi:hypothetical protein
MTSGSGWGAEAGNPTVAGDNMTFPFDRIASTVLDVVPGGLVASPAVLSEFLDPPDARGAWFCNAAWQQASLLLRKDDGITADEYQDLIARFNRIQDALIRWTELRPDMTKGYAETLPDNMRRAGASAWTDIRNLSRGPLATLSAEPGVADDTKQALENFGQVLWEYVRCMAFELEASHDQIDVPAVRDRFAAEATNPWEPAVTPDNIDDGGITAGAHRLPPAPSPPSEPPASGDPSVSEPTTEPPTPPDPPDPGIEDPGSRVGEGGEVGK